jgi:hypothetical protein
MRISSLAPLLLLLLLSCAPALPRYDHPPIAHPDAPCESYEYRVTGFVRCTHARHEWGFWADENGTIVRCKCRF